MQLKSDRLLLTSLQPEDWPLFQQVHQDAVSMTWIGAVPDDDDLQKRFRDRLLPWYVTSCHMLCLVVRDRHSNSTVGLVGASAEWQPHRQCEVGYAFLSEHHGKGYGGEALQLLCQFLFEQCDFHKLKAHVVEGNGPSRRILEKNGFQLEGTLRDNYLLRGEWVNDWVFGRLKSGL